MSKKGLVITCHMTSATLATVNGQSVMRLCLLSNQPRQRHEMIVSIEAWQASAREMPFTLEPEGDEMVLYDGMRRKVPLVSEKL